jgi:hypothetical protein
MRYYVLTILLFLISTFGSLRTATAATPERLELGHTSTGAVVTLIRAGAGWSISIGGPSSPLLSQPEPARVEVSALTVRDGCTGRCLNATAKASSEMNSKEEESLFLRPDLKRR